LQCAQIKNVAEGLVATDLQLLLIGYIRVCLQNLLVKRKNVNTSGITQVEDYITIIKNMKEKIKESIERILLYSLVEERDNLEELMFTNFDLDVSKWSDERLYNYCINKGIDHIWTDFHNLTLL